MEAITEETENKLDELKTKYGEMSYTDSKGIKIPGTSVFGYGEIDINNVDDIEFINSLNIISPEVWCPYVSVIPTGFNYEEGTITTDDEGIVKVTDTWDKFNWFKYHYCLIGKPKRIIIYEVNKFWYKEK